MLTVSQPKSHLVNFTHNLRSCCWRSMTLSCRSNAGDVGGLCVRYADTYNTKRLAGKFKTILATLKLILGVTLQLVML